MSFNIMKNKYNIIQSMLFSSALIWSSSVNATNGLWLPGYGAKSAAMGGTSIAIPHDAVAPASNPANIAGMGTRLDVGVGLFNPPRTAYVDASGSFFGDSIGGDQSDRNLFVVPNLGYTYELNDKFTLGFTMYGNGLGVWYPNNFYDFSGSAAAPLSISLTQVLAPLTIAYKATDTWSLAFSLVLGAQDIKVQGFTSFASVSRDPSALTDNGHDQAFGYGARIGISKTMLDERLRIGAYYASKVYFSKFDDYAGLIAEQGKLDVPPSYGLGIAYSFTPKTLVGFDIVRIPWSEVAAIGNRGPELFTGEPLGTAAAGGAGQIGADDGMGFGWVDRTVYKLGLRYNLSETWSLSTGLNYSETPIPDDQLAFGVIGPATTEKHISIGTTKILDGFTIFGGEQAEVTFAFWHAVKNKLSGLSPLGTNAETGQAFAGYAEFEMVQNVFELSYGLKF